MFRGADWEAHDVLGLLVFTAGFLAFGCSKTSLTKGVLHSVAYKKADEKVHGFILREPRRSSPRRP